MMKKPIFCLMGLTMIFSCAPKLNNDKAKISYAIGQQIGQNLKRSNIDIDSSVLARSIEDSVAGKKSAMTDQEMQAAMTTLQAQSQKKLEEAGAKNLAKGQEFLKENAAKPGVKTTPKGIQYIVVKEGSGKSPKKPEDSVTVKYTGTLITGEVFDSSERTGKPAEFKIGQVIPGFQDGLMHMKEGGIYKFFIPPNLGYGATDRPGIPPQSVLIFEVELIKVK